MATFCALFVAAAALGMGEDLPADRADARVVVDDMDQFEGEWRVVEMQDKGKATTVPAEIRIVIRQGHMMLNILQTQGEKYDFQINANATPKQFDLVHISSKAAVTGVYEVRDGKLYLYYRNGKVRPTTLGSPKEGGMMVLKRVKDK